MGRARFQSLGDLTAVEVSSAADISELEDASIMVGGTFVATYDVEISFDAGTTWQPHPDGTGLSAPKVLPMGMRVQQVRVNCTAFTSGSLACRLGGSDGDRRG